MYIYIYIIIIDLSINVLRLNYLVDWLTKIHWFKVWLSCDQNELKAVIEYITDPFFGFTSMICLSTGAFIILLFNQVFVIY